jgi:hypothetical protein
MADSIFTLIGRQTRGIVGEKLDITGGTLTGDLFLNSAPSADLQASTKKYVDDSVSALNIADYARLDGADFTGNITGTNLTLSGNLTVNGSVTSLDTTNSTLADALILLSKGASDNTNASTDAGILIERGSSEQNVAVYWDETDDKFRFVSTDKDATATDLSDGGNTAEADISVKGINTNGNDLGTVEEFFGQLVVSVGTASVLKSEFDANATLGVLSITGVASPLSGSGVTTSYGTPDEITFTLTEVSNDSTNTVVSLQTTALSENALNHFRGTGDITVGTDQITFL